MEGGEEGGEDGSIVVSTISEVGIDDGVDVGGCRLENDRMKASLPPPPSALSPSSSRTHSEASDEEREDDQPPDFTSQAPVSPTRRRKSPKLTESPRWGGLQLGGGPIGGILGSKRSAGMGARERALWRWINVEDLDGFLQEVYLYYVGKGIWAIGLSRLLNLL
jgi:hypothetical protein